MCSTADGIDVSVFRYKMYANITIKHEHYATLDSPCKKLIDVDGTSNVVVQTSNKLQLFNFSSGTLETIKDTNAFLSPNSFYVEGLINLISKDDKLSVMTSIYDNSPI